MRSLYERTCVSLLNKYTETQMLAGHVFDNIRLQGPRQLCRAMKGQWQGHLHLLPRLRTHAATSPSVHGTMINYVHREIYTDTDLYHSTLTLDQNRFTNTVKGTWGSTHKLKWHPHYAFASSASLDNAQYIPIYIRRNKTVTHNM
jgi:hypothetical protein